MQEMPSLSRPLCGYQKYILGKISPYYDITVYVLEEMENNFRLERREFFYKPNIAEIGKKVREKTRNERVTKFNVQLSLLAWVKTAGLSNDDFYKSSGAKGKRNYHIRVNERTLERLRSLL